MAKIVIPSARRREPASAQPPLAALIEQFISLTTDLALASEEQAARVEAHAKGLREDRREVRREDQENRVKHGRLYSDLLGANARIEIAITRIRTAISNAAISRSSRY